MPPRCPRGRTSRRRVAERGGPLQDDLPHEQHQRARDVEAVGEKRAVAGVRLLLGLHPADRQDHWSASPGEQVAATRAPVDEQALPDGVAALDLGAVCGRRAAHHRAGLLLDPAERRDVVVGAEQDPGLATPRSARRGRSPIRRDGGSPRRASAPCSARCRRASRAGAPAARARRSRETRSPVDPSRTAPGRPARDPLDHPQRVGVVVVGAKEHLKGNADRRGHKGDAERRPE